MDVPPPHNNGGADGRGPPGKGQQENRGGNGQAVLDLLGVDLGTAAVVLVMLMLQLTGAAMTRCECL
jgi:hypothetical protein